jgi:hypothetical protein
MLRRSLAITFAAITLVVAAGLLGGCANATQSSQSAGAAPTVLAARLPQMTPADKISQIASNFPMQIPVPAGQVERGEAQGRTAWDYTLVVPGSVAAVQAWYLEAYTGAEWTVVAQSASSLSLQKNRAQTQLQFDAVDGSLLKTRVTGAVGVGTQVLQPQ